MLVNRGKGLSDLHPHILGDEGMEREMEEGGKRRIEVKGMEVLVVLGSDPE